MTEKYCNVLKHVCNNINLSEKIVKNTKYMNVCNSCVYNGLQWGCTHLENRIIYTSLSMLVSMQCPCLFFYMYSAACVPPSTLKVDGEYAYSVVNKCKIFRNTFRFLLCPSKIILTYISNAKFGIEINAHC